MAGNRLTRFISAIDSYQAEAANDGRNTESEIMLRNVLFVSQAGALLVASALSLQSGTAIAEETQLMEEFSMVMRPPAEGVQVDDNEAQDISNFFHHAERAIQSENIEALMALYSDEYTNERDGDKQFAADLWKKVFARFDNISSRHSMKLIDYDRAAGRAVTACSGLLFGTPEGDSNPVLIDRWDDQRHILSKEGDWKLLGNTGVSTPSATDNDDDLHPLF